MPSVAMISAKLAGLFERSGQYDRAEIMRQESLLARERLYRCNPSRHAKDFAIANNSLGALLEKVARKDEALEYYLKAIEVCNASTGLKDYGDRIRSYVINNFGENSLEGTTSL